MTKIKKLLTKTTVELVEGRELLRERKKRLRSAVGDKVQAQNAKIAVKLIEQAVKSIAEHRELLKEQLAIPQKGS